jgi:hypothetical protein
METETRDRGGGAEGEGADEWCSGGPLLTLATQSVSARAFLSNLCYII